MKTIKSTRPINFLLILLIGMLFSGGLYVNSAWAASKLLKASEIEKIGTDFMFETLEWDKDRLEIKVIYDGNNIRIPQGNVKFDCKLPGRKRRVGRIHFLCLIKVEGNTKKRLRLYANVKVAYDVYRPIQSLKMGHILQPEDIELTLVKSDRVLRNIVSDENEILGHRLVRNLDQGEIILTHMVKRVPVVKNGDRILLVAKKGLLRITVPGVVRQSGFKNDTVRVENIQSRKIILGTVIDSRTVQINF